MKVIGYMSHGQIEILETLPLTGAAKINGRPTERYCVPVVKLEDASREVNAINMSIEAQVARTALKQLWEMLGVEDQTGAVLALRGELPRKEWPVVPPMFSYSSVVKHRKGGYYEIIGTPARCRWEITGEPVYFYRALIDDTIWVRTQAVMEDGRFEKTGLSVAEANGLMSLGGPYGEG